MAANIAHTFATSINVDAVSVFFLTNNTLTMWSILSIIATLSLASASPVFRRDDGEGENLDDNDNEISCVKYKFSGESAC